MNKKHYTRIMWINLTIATMCLIMAIAGYKSTIYEINFISLGISMANLYFYFLDKYKK